MENIDYISVQENLLFDCSNLAMDLEELINDQFIAGTINREVYNAVIKRIRQWVEDTKCMMRVHSDAGDRGKLIWSIEQYIYNRADCCEKSINKYGKPTK